MSRPIHWCPTCGYKIMPDTAYSYRPETELVSEEDYYYYGLLLCTPCGKAFIAIPYSDFHFIKLMREASLKIAITKKEEG